MADENTEEKKKGGLLKLLMFIGGGILLIGIGLGVGFFLFGSKAADPSEEIEEIIERKMKVCSKFLTFKGEEDNTFLSSET